MPFRTIVILTISAVVLAGCVVVPARPVYYRPAPVVVY
ncbi:membrane protein [Burkholderia territorii]|nr:membrane protein [Burkholderia territorii]